MELTAVGWVLLAIFVIIAATNAVNLTDGLDGLAAGSSTFCFGVLSIIGYWQFRHFSIYHLQPLSTSASSRWASWAAVSVSFGGTRRPRRSSWVIPARSPSAQGSGLSAS